MSTADSIQRSVLPIPDRKPVGLTTYDAKDPDTKFPPITPLRPPVGAPNVLIILLDDVGFGASSAFGGPCQTPTAEGLATALRNTWNAKPAMDIVVEFEKSLKKYPPIAPGTPDPYTPSK